MSIGSETIKETKILMNLLESWIIKLPKIEMNI